MIELLLQAERAMSVGLVDRAEVLYRQVAEADPQNSIAVVGLARVALERGDEAGALALAQRALTIDPENAAAARMVERLDEVLAYRGEAPAATEEEPIVTSAQVAAPTPTPTTPAPAPPVAAPPATPVSTPPPPRPSLLARLFGRFRRR